jgi:hypothetical protein
MEMNTQNKLAPKVKTLFHFTKKKNGTQLAPSETTSTITVTHVTVSV